MFIIQIGMTGFEPATPCSQGRCATKLRYIPSTTIVVTPNLFVNSSGDIILNLLHETQTEAIKLGLQRIDLKIDPQKIKQKISEQMTEELVGKISYKIFLVTEPSAISCFFNFR